MIEMSWLLFFCGSSRRDVSAEDVAKQVFSEDGLGNDWHFDVDTKTI